MTQPLILIAAGGTGGHMFPAQALAESMLTRGWRVTLSTDVRGARYTGEFPDQVDVVQSASATFAHKGLRTKLAAPFQIMRGIASALRYMRRTRPAVVVGFGGYPAIPAMTAATLLGLPRMIHEQNGVLGRVNQLFARRVNMVACGIWPTALPDGTRSTYVGNPIRASIAKRSGAAYIIPGDYPMKLLVIGGSQGARILADTVPAAIAMLPDGLRRNLHVIQQARPEDNAAVRAAYDALGMRADIAPFIADVPRHLAEAQLVISRAGASSVADIATIGRPSILIPLAAAIRDEQTANARTLLEAGAGILIPETQLTPATLAAQITTILEQPQAAAKMARAALETARPGAAHTLADIAERLAFPQKDTP